MLLFPAFYKSRQNLPNLTNISVGYSSAIKINCFIVFISHYSKKKKYIYATLFFMKIQNFGEVTHCSW
jgi:hypothetical protein